MTKQEILERLKSETDRRNEIFEREQRRRPIKENVILPEENTKNKTKEETPKEYAEKVLKGERPEQDDK